MATLIYKGGQPASNSGWLSGMGSWSALRRCVVELARWRLVVNLEGDASGSYERRGKAASCAVTERASKVAEDGVRARPTQLQGLAAVGSAGGIVITTRGLPSERATIALPVATA